ncbi:MAG TPA: hypothetical protein VGG29_20755 [Caulobacteraceae bacterium]|jgi:hypothetical protein
MATETAGQTVSHADLVRARAAGELAALGEELVELSHRAGGQAVLAERAGQRDEKLKQEARSAAFLEAGTRVVELSRRLG